MQLLLDALGANASRWDFHTPRTLSIVHVRPMKSDVELVTKGLPRASRPLAILKFPPTNSLDDKTYHRSQMKYEVNSIPLLLKFKVGHQRLKMAPVVWDSLRGPWNVIGSFDLLQVNLISCWFRTWQHEIPWVLYLLSSRLKHLQFSLLLLSMEEHSSWLFGNKYEEMSLITINLMATITTRFTNEFIMHVK